MFLIYSHIGNMVSRLIIISLYIHTQYTFEEESIVSD
jgi:hypothetical protein